MHVGVLPVKRLVDAKSRLSPYLDAARRTEVALALLDDALRMCEEVDFLQWWVVTDDEQVQESSSARGLRVLADPGRGLNAALSLALDDAAKGGAESATVVPADVPLAKPDDFEDVLDTGATSDVVVVPAARDGGTNALHLTPPNLIAPRFGSQSMRAHLVEADRLAMRASILSLPRLSLDIDTIEDVEDLVGQPDAQETRAGRVLRRFRANDALT